jgi:uncharacterized protein YcfL
MKKFMMILLVAVLLLTACGSKPETTINAAEPISADVANEAVSEPEEDSVGVPSKDDLSGALNLLLGGTDTASVFDSYHLEMVLDTPQANDDYTVVVNEKVSVSADIAGNNVSSAAQKKSTNWWMVSGKKPWDRSPWPGLCGLCR